MMIKLFNVIQQYDIKLIENWTTRKWETSASPFYKAI